MRLRIRSTGAWVAAQRDPVFSPHPFREGVQVTAEGTHHRVQREKGWGCWGATGGVKRVNKGL